MRYIRDYVPAPIEYHPDIDSLLTSDYVMWCDEYSGAYIMSQYLAKLPCCDFSPPTDDFYFQDGVIHSNWVIFFTCRPKDADRMQYVANRLLPKYYINMEEYI